MYFRICPRCGCNLDPGERCDCLEVEEAKEKEKQERLKQMEENVCVDSDGQFRFALM